MKTVFDVGAHYGDWAHIASSYFPKAKISCFEIIPETFAKLKTKIGEDSNITLNSIGLSDQVSKVSIHYDPERTAQSTIFEPSVAGNFRKLEVDVTRGDLYCKSHGIHNIDFLKIDVEGAEHLVLLGFSELLEQKNIRVIQFEYGNCNKETHFLLLDFYKNLEGYGYKIGKIFPYGVEFKKYELADEDFIGPNYVAVLESESRLIDRLRTF